MSQWTASRPQQAARPKHVSQHPPAQHPNHHPVPHLAHHQPPIKHPPPPHKQQARDNHAELKRSVTSLALGRSAYTFTHGGRQVRLGPVAFWICVGTLVIMAGWSIAAATYLTFRDDVLQPYQMVKDLRTGVSTSDTGGVLNGDIDQFTEAALAQKAFGTAPTHVEDVE